MSILLIEDDQSLAELLTEFLSLSGYEVVHCADGEAGLNTAMNTSGVELVLLDIMLPKLNGLDVLKQLRQHSELPVLMLTARGDDVDKVLGLELGADDYLAKPFNDRELLARIRAITRRTRETSEPERSAKAPLRFGDLTIDTAKMAVMCKDQNLELTGSEYALLKHLCSSPGELISKAELSQQCFGRRLQAFDRSIDTHISNLRKKLQAAQSACEVKSQRGRGYGLVEG